jgi:hypothetical protein
MQRSVDIFRPVPGQLPEGGYPFQRGSAEKARRVQRASVRSLFWHFHVCFSQSFQQKPESKDFFVRIQWHRVSVTKHWMSVNLSPRRKYTVLMSPALPVRSVSPDSNNELRIRSILESSSFRCSTLFLYMGVQFRRDTVDSHHG